MVDVLGVRGEAVVDPGKGGGQPGHGGGLRAEVGVQVLQARRPDFHGENQRLAHGDPVVVIGQVGQAAKRRQGLAGLHDQLPVQFGVVELVTDAAHRRPHAGDGFLEVGLADGAEREDLDLHPGLFEGEDFIDHEGLGKTGVTLQDIANGKRCVRGGHGGFLGKGVDGGGIFWPSDGS